MVSADLLLDGDVSIAEDEIAEDEIAEDEIAEDEIAEDEIAEDEACLGIDVGGTKVLGLLVNTKSGQIYRRHRVPTPKSGAEDLVLAIGEVVEALVDDRAQIPAIGLGLPGLVDRAGVLHVGPHLPEIIGVDMGALVAREIGVEIVVDNDATNAARAEHRLGAAQGYDDAIVVTQGTGIGGGLIINGQIVRGANGFAGEPGHMRVDANGYPCACGRSGCWETLSSGSGLVNLAGEILEQGRGGRITEIAGGRSHMAGEHIAQAFIEGDPDAQEIVARFAYSVAVGLGNLISILDPGVIVLGGGRSTFGPHFIDQVSNILPSVTMGGNFRPSVPILRAKLGPDAGAIGGAINASLGHYGR